MSRNCELTQGEKKTRSNEHNGAEERDERRERGREK